MRIGSRSRRTVDPRTCSTHASCSDAQVSQVLGAVALRYIVSVYMHLQRPSHLTHRTHVRKPLDSNTLRPLFLSRLSILFQGTANVCTLPFQTPQYQGLSVASLHTPLPDKLSVAPRVSPLGLRPRLNLGAHLRLPCHFPKVDKGAFVLTDELLGVIQVTKMTLTIEQRALTQQRGSSQ
jgi:hypothetical protein